MLGSSEFSRVLESFELCPQVRSYGFSRVLEVVRSVGFLEVVSLVGFLEVLSSL